MLVTGAAGWIGSRLVRQLARHTDSIYALVRPTSDLWRINDRLDRVTLVRVDLQDNEAVDRALAPIRPEICFHFAWHVAPGAYLHSDKNVDALASSIRLALTLRRLKCERFVGIGSCFEYDTTDGYLDEDASLRPRTLYAASKLALWLVLEQVASGDMHGTWARLFYQFGPMESPDRLVSSVILSLLHGQSAEVSPGMQTRDFLHVDDVASAIIAVAGARLDGPVNIGSGRAVTVSDVVRLLGTLIGRPQLIALGARPYATGDPMVVCAKPTRLVGTGWRPAYGLEDGLMDTVQWWAGREGVVLAGPSSTRDQHS